MNVTGAIRIDLEEVAPKIIDGYWHEWVDGAWVNTGQKATGEDGVGILEVIDWYAISTDGVNAPGTGWQTTVPSKPANYFMWNYEVITYTDNRTPTQTQKRVIQGKDARSISYTRNAFAYSSSNTVSPSSPWMWSVADLGARPSGYYLWMRDDVFYTDGTSNSTLGRLVVEGASGAGEQTIYYNANIYPANPVGDNPIGWYWYPIAPSEQYKMVFISKRQKPEGGSWGPWSSVQLYNEYRASAENNPTYLMMGFWVKPVANDPKKPFYRKTELGTPMVKHLDGTALGYSVYVLEVDVSDDMPPSPSNPQWRMIESLEVLYLQNAYIERLQAELITATKINTLELNAKKVTALDSESNKIATMNEFGDGAYIQYYPSGRRRMEFGGGLIIYYEDNLNNTVKWTMGYSGNVNHGSLDRWRETYLAPTDTNGSNVKKLSVTGDKYKIFSPGTGSSYASYSGLTVKGTVSDSTVPTAVSTVDYIPAGWYAVPGIPMRNLDDPEDTYRRELRYYMSGKLSTTKQIIFTINEELPQEM